MTTLHTIVLRYGCTKGNGFPYLWKGYLQPTFSEKFSEDEDYKDGHTKVQGSYYLRIKRDPQLLARPQVVLIIHHYQNAV